MATIEDVVKKSNVSRSTVFRFLNGQNVRKQSEQKIVEAMKNLNYKVEEIQKRNGFLIEVSIPSAYNEFQGFSEIVQGIMESAEEMEISVQLCRREGRQIDEDYSKWSTRNEHIGVIVIGKNKEDDIREAKFLKEKNIPHIFVNREIEDKEVNSIGPDLERAAYDIVNLLVQSGHERILTLGKPEESLVDEKKILGYKRALCEAKLNWERNFFTYKDHDEWESIIRGRLRESNPPDSFFGLCDSYSIRFANIAREEGFKIPEDISIIGMDDIDMAKYSFPPLTTVDIPFKQMGIVAVKQMISLFNNEYKNIRIGMEYKIVKRDSILIRNK